MTAPIPADAFPFDGFRPDRLWSLWDMSNNFFFPPVHELLGNLGDLISISHKNLQFIEIAGGYDSPDVQNDPGFHKAISQSIESVSHCVKACETLLGGLKCIHINDAAKRLEYWPKTNPLRWNELNTRARALRDNIQSELKGYLYYQYPKAQGEKLRAWKEEWKAALGAFPRIRADAFDATDCYGMGKNTACVFHCMRVLEIGLRALAENVGLKFDVQQWKNIIDEIEREIEKIRDNGLPGVTKADKDARLQFLSEAAKEFFYFKDGWRNYVSHNRMTSDEFDALRTLEHVRSFMNHLSEQLSGGAI